MIYYLLMNGLKKIYNMTKEEFLAFSLPYRLKCNDRNPLDKTSVYTYCGVFYGQDKENNYENVKPILHPLSDLTKEIDHNGERFIPMVRLFEYLQTNHFSDNPLLKLVKFNKDNIISCEFKKYENVKMSDCILKHTVKFNDDNIEIHSFRYECDIHRFINRNETQRRPLGIPYQLDLFQKLIEWHFDIGGLIDKNEAIDVNTLESNPYK